MTIYILVYEQNTDYGCGADVSIFLNKADAQAAMRAEWEVSVENWKYNSRDHKDEDACYCEDESAVIRDGMDSVRWRIEEQSLDVRVAAEVKGDMVQSMYANTDVNPAERVAGGKAMKKEPFDIPSQEDIAAMIERNENFDGRQADFAKLRLYQEIKADLLEFLHLCDDVLRLEEIKPNKYERNALISLDVSIVATFDQEETAMLTAIMNKADRMVVNGTGGEFVRFSFGVENIWIE